MRIALVLASNLYMAPYVRYYTEILEQCGIPYDIISWNRLGVEEVGVKAFNFNSSETKSIFGKMLDYIRYQRFLKSKLPDGNYDKVIVFTIQNTLLLSSFLRGNYKNRYAIDIRDHSIALKLLKLRFTSVIKNAAMVVISSTGFKQWLPKDNTYLIRHNTTVFRPVGTLVNIEGQTKYKILTIGSLRDFETNRVLIEQLKNSPIFELEYVGSGPADTLLKNLVTSNGITNVNFLGRYLKEDETKYLHGASFINILTNEDINSMTLMSNRFYLSVVYGIPMIVNENTEQARWVRKYNLGIVINKKIDIKNQIIQYLPTFDRKTFDAGRKACLQIVQQDVTEFESKFKEFLSCDT